MAADRDKMDRLFEEKGEIEIRQMLKTQVISGRNADYMLAKLERLDRERDLAAKARESEIAESMEKAAWASAEEARQANKHAKSANRIAIAALVIAVAAAVGAFWPN